MPAQITWVNHASFVYDDGHARILCDPWIEGRTFYNGWDLLAPTAMTFDDFADITHIWISHEHPDHLSPPNLARIPADVRARISLLYQTAPVRRVAKYLSSLGFKEVTELQPDWYRLSSATEIFCGACRSSTSDDSYLAIRSGDATVLNLNDCVPPDFEAIRHCIGKIDVLLAQFSFACWTGNRDQPEKRAQASEMATASFLRSVRAIGAPFVIPAASFSWFCNTENSWMNQAARHVGEIAEDLTREGMTPVVLYPGDQWTIGEGHDNRSSIERYDERYDLIARNPPFFENPVVGLPTLRTRAQEFAKGLRAANNPSSLQACGRQRFISMTTRKPSPSP